MKYYIDDTKVAIDGVKTRLRETDLIPSRTPLLDNLEENMARLRDLGYDSLAVLRKALKNPKNIPAVAERTGIDVAYLTLLRREIEGWFPKACPLSAFDWLPVGDLTKLADGGYKNSVLLFEALFPDGQADDIAKKTGVDPDVLSELKCLANLTRIRWTSPLAARMLLSVGYSDAAGVAAADAEELCAKLEAVNSENGYFKGNIGLRDVRRLIKAASWL